MNPAVDEFLSTAKWQKEMVQLRSIVLECELIEELKWRQPCYTYKDGNILLIGGFKDYCTLSFFKGVLLSDTNALLVKPGENSQTVRMMKFTDVKEILDLKSVIKTYIYEAIEVEKSGVKVDFKESKALTLPDELLLRFDQNPEFKSAFEALTPGRQRGYNLYFSAPKQSKTREARIEKYVPRILNGKGIHDCVCGHSKKMPNCDGSHNHFK